MALAYNFSVTLHFITSRYKIIAILSIKFGTIQIQSFVVEFPLASFGKLTTSSLIWLLSVHVL